MKTRTGHWHSAATLSLLLFLGGCSSESAPQFQSQPAAIGTITFLTSDTEGPGTCHFDGSDQKMRLGEFKQKKTLSPCNMNNPSQVVFTTVPSATTISFVAYTNGFGCNEGSAEKYRISFKTRGAYTSDKEKPWNIQDLLRTARAGQAMDHNFQVTLREVQSDIGDNYDYLWNLSCIFINDAN